MKTTNELVTELKQELQILRSCINKYDKSLIPGYERCIKDLEVIQNLKYLKGEEKLESPHKCPVCNGTMVVPNGFYTQTSGQWLSTDVTPEPCRSCQGSGVVWKS